MEQKTDPTRALLNDVLVAAIALTGAQMGNIQLLDRGRLKIVAQRGFRAPFLKFFDQVENGRAACGEATQRRAQVVVEDVTSHPIFMGTRELEEVMAAGVRAVQSTPMIDSKGELLGMLSTHFSEPHRPDKRQLMLLDLLARGAAASIERDATGKKVMLMERQLEKITDEVASPITQCSRELRYIFANKAYAKVIGRPVEEIVGRPIVEVLGQEAFHTIRPHIDRVLAGERVEYETVIAYPAGLRYMQVAYVPDRDESGVHGWFAGMTDITERQRAQEELARVAGELKEEDRRKDEYLATLAHELRNPLAAVRNGVEILKRAGDDRHVAKPALDMVDRQLIQVVRLIDDLMDVSRLKLGRIQVRKTRVDAAIVVREAVEGLRSSMERMGHELSFECSASSVELDADEARLTQVVVNLVFNAAKSMTKGGRIILDLERISDQAVIRVRDQGIGFEAGEADRLFHIFSQLESSRHRFSNGLGVGLALAKGIVDMHDGTIEARSDGIGRGSEFIVRLPVASEHAADIAVAEQGVVIKRRILIVDDNHDNATSMATLLKMAGHVTHTASDGIEALEAAGRLRPDVVLLDVGLPKLNGYDVCRGIRKEPWGKRMLLIALTGYGQQTDVQDAMDAGFDQHLAKPVTQERLNSLFSAHRS